MIAQKVISRLEALKSISSLDPPITICDPRSEPVANMACQVCYQQARSPSRLVIDEPETWINLISAGALKYHGSVAIMLSCCITLLLTGGLFDGLSSEAAKCSPACCVCSLQQPYHALIGCERAQNLIRLQMAL